MPPLPIKRNNFDIKEQNMIFKNGERNLNASEKEILNNFYFLFTKELSKQKIRNIYRGDNLKNVKQKLGLNNNDLPELCYKIFLFGDKAKHYYSHVFLSDQKGRVFSINDVSEAVFNYIFEKISKAIKNHHPSTNLFFIRNQKFVEFFSKSDNKTVFRDRISILSLTEKFFIRNYYLRLLHQLAANGYKLKSHLISTSNAYTVASLFAKRVKDGNDIIFHGWANKTITSSNNIKKHQLPFYYGTPYAQKEISILAGLLPHYIIGFELVQQNTFYVNPSLFKTVVSEKTFIEGFNVDQTNFYEELPSTGFNKSFVVINGRDYFDIE